MQFSVFTPVFNGKETIHRVWDSLQFQTCRDFEWIIVNDGSTDNITELLYEYKNSATFSLTILNQVNMGKHFAWNKAIKIAKGELFVPADADDEFMPTTLEVFSNCWQKHKKNDIISGINVLCMNPLNDQIVGDEFPYDGIITNNLELIYKYKLRGEKWGCIRTDILQNYPFPEIKGRSSYFPSYIWYSIARNYKVICLNIALRKYYTNEKGITANAIRTLRKDAPTIYHYDVWHLNTNKDYIFKYLGNSEIFKLYIKHWYYGLFAGTSVRTVFKNLQGTKSKLLLVFSLMPGLLYNWLLKICRDT